MLHLVVILQPSEASRNDGTVHKMMVQYFFPPAGDIKVEDAVSIEPGSMCVIILTTFC